MDTREERPLSKVFAVMGGLMWLISGCPDGVVGLFMWVLGGALAWLALKFLVFDTLFNLFH